MMLELHPPGRAQRTKAPANRERSKGHNGKGNYAVFVYVAYCKGFAKIGISEDPRCRVRSMQSGCPFPIELLSAVPLSQASAIAAEREVMLALAAARWAGEWCKCSRNQALFALERGAAQFRAATVPVIKGSEPRPPRRLPARHPSLTRKVVTPDGVFASASDAARHYGISRQAAHQRAQRGSGGWRFDP